MRESTCFDIIARWNAESAPRIWARAAFSSNDPAAVLDADDGSAVAELVLLQPSITILPASRAIPPHFRISAPVNGFLLYAPKDFRDAVPRHGRCAGPGAEIAGQEGLEPLLAFDAARSRKTPPLQSRRDEEVDVLGVMITRHIIGPVAAANWVIVGGVQCRLGGGGVAMSSRAYPHPMFLRDDLALRTREFRSFSALDVACQVPNP